MALLSQPSVEYEFSQVSYPWEDMTTSNNILFSATFAPWSAYDSTKETVVRPYGIISGGAITPAASGTNNLVDVATLTLYMPGAAGADANGLVTVSAATDETIARPVNPDTHKISSVTVDASGAIAIVAGTDSTSFSATRAAAGGPPLIPVDSVEIGQVRYTSDTAAAVLASEIYQDPNVHMELSAYPVWTEDPAAGQVTFQEALPLIHTGGVPKKVSVKGYTPSFAELTNAYDFVPASDTATGSSERTYTGTSNSASLSGLAACSFSAKLSDGVNDAILARLGKTVWVRFKPDRDKTAHQLTRGLLTSSETYEADADPSVDFTLTPTFATKRYSS